MNDTGEAIAGIIMFAVFGLVPICAWFTHVIHCLLTRRIESPPFLLRRMDDGCHGIEHGGLQHSHHSCHP